MSHGPRIPDPESALAQTARLIVEPMQKAVNRYKWIVRVTVVIMVLIAVGAWELWQQNSRACNAGNGYRASQTAIWNDFIGILIQPRHPTQAQSAAAQAFLDTLPAHDAAAERKLLALLNVGPTDPETHAKAQAFAAYIASVDKPHSCPPNLAP